MKCICMYERLRGLNVSAAVTVLILEYFAFPPLQIKIFNLILRRNLTSRFEFDYFLHHITVCFYWMTGAGVFLFVSFLLDSLLNLHTGKRAFCGHSANTGTFHVLWRIKCGRCWNWNTNTAKKIALDAN